MRRWLILTAPMGMAALWACRQDRSAAELQIDLVWSQSNECKEHSPEIKVSRLPSEGQFRRVRLID